MSDREVVVVREPQRGLAFPDLREIWRSRDFLAALIRRDIKVHYQQTVLGPFWLLVQPVVTTIILATMLTKVISLPTDGQPAPLFYLAAMIMWSYFSEVVFTIAYVFITHEYLFGKVAFLRIMLPVSTALSKLIGLSLQLLMVGLLIAVMTATGSYSYSFGNLWLLPVTLVFLIAVSLGLGLLVASTTTRYRDIANAVPFALQSAFFVTPILFSFSMVPAQWRLPLAVLNPLTVLSDLWRGALSNAPVVSSHAEIAAAALSSFAILIIGTLAFHTAQRNAPDTI